MLEKVINQKNGNAMGETKSFLAFICGDVTVTIWLKLGGIVSSIGHFGLQVASVLVLGIAGGIAGVVGKDLYAYAKKEIKRFRR